MNQKVLLLCFHTLRAGAIYRFPFWERFLFCPTLRQTCCREDKSTQETPPCGLIGYEGWDSLMGWQLPPSRTLPGGGGRRGREAEEEKAPSRRPLAVGGGPQIKWHHFLKDPHKVKSDREGDNPVTETSVRRNRLWVTVSLFRLKTIPLEILSTALIIFQLLECCFFCYSFTMFLTIL